MHYSLLTPNRNKGTKRVGEPASSADRNPDTKRARVASGSSQTSPKATPKVSPALPPTPASTTTATPSTQASPSVSVTGNVASSSSTTQPQATPASAPIPSIPNQKSFAMLMDRYKAMELSMRHKVNVMEAHKAAGRLKESAALKAEIQDLMPKLNRFKAVLIQAQAQQAGQMKQPPQANQQPQPSPQISQPQPAQQPAQVAEGSQSQVPLAQPTSTVPTVEATTTATSVQSTTTPLQQPQQVTAPTQIQALPAQVESAQGGGVGLHVPPNTSPQMAAAHMQKLIEQRNRTPVLSKASIPGPQQPGAEHGQSVGNVAGVGGVTPQAPTGTGHQASVWKGTLSWRGSDSETQARKELRAQVIVQAQIDQM